jgi:hypothetical protein
LLIKADLGLDGRFGIVHGVLLLLLCLVMGRQQFRP